MKTIAKLMALCLLLGTLGFAQAAGGDTKKDDTKKSDTAKPKKTKTKKDKKKKGAAEDTKKDAGADKGDKK